jgi:hypothetical protein
VIVGTSCEGPLEFRSKTLSPKKNYIACVRLFQKFVARNTLLLKIIGLKSTLQKRLIDNTFSGGIFGPHVSVMAFLIAEIQISIF